jgi:hypothetical protein
MLVRLWLTAALAAGLACAQGRGIGDMGGGDMGAGGGRGMGAADGMGDAGGGMPRGAQRQTKAEIFMDKLKLNKDQKEEAVKILTESAQQAAPLAQKINNGRLQIAQSLLQKKTEDEMKPLMDAYTAVCAQMTSLEAQAFGKIYAILKPNQQKNAPQAFEILGGLFFPAQAPGGRGRGGSGRGGRN